MSSPLGASLHMLLGSPHAFVSCKVVQPSLSLFHGKGLAKPGCLNSKKPSSRWQTGLQARGSFVVAAVATVLPAEKTLHLLKEEEESKDIASDVPSKSDMVFLEDEEKLDYKERTRRMRISKANRGKVPWNKGRKHSPETLERIKERTKQAMKNPKIRQKLVLAQCARPQSYQECLLMLFKEHQGL